MNAVDWVIVAVVALSMLLGVLRGFVREVMSLVGWVVGIWLAIRFAPVLGRELPAEMAIAEIRTGIAALGIVIGTIVVAALIAWVIGKFLSAIKLTGTDRLLGAAFGFVRALLIVLLVGLFAGRTALAQQPLWRDSVLLAHVEAAVRFAAPLLPPALAARNRT
jgi:membrane protein required for colicin V production